MSKATKRLTTTKTIKPSSQKTSNDEKVLVEDKLDKLFVERNRLEDFYRVLEYYKDPLCAGTPFSSLAPKFFVRPQTDTFKKIKTLHACAKKFKEVLSALPEDIRWLFFNEVQPFTPQLWMEMHGIDVDPEISHISIGMEKDLGSLVSICDSVLKRFPKPDRYHHVKKNMRFYVIMVASILQHQEQSIPNNTLHWTKGYWTFSETSWCEDGTHQRLAQVISALNALLPKRLHITNPTSLVQRMLQDGDFNWLVPEQFENRQNS